jgi:hypothetical protein
LKNDNVIAGGNHEWTLKGRQLPITIFQFPIFNRLLRVLRSRAVELLYARLPLGMLLSDSAFGFLLAALSRRRSRWVFGFSLHSAWLHGIYRPRNSCALNRKNPS